MENTVQRIALSSGEQATELVRPVALWTTPDGLTVIGSSDGIDIVRDVSGDDLLQQAMNEVSGAFGRSGEILYSSDGALLTYDNLVAQGNVSAITVTPQPDGDSSGIDIGTACLQVGDSAYTYLTSNASNDVASLSNLVTQNCVSTASSSFVSEENVGVISTVPLQDAGMLAIKESDTQGEVIASSVGLTGNAVDVSAPLGSSRNPIRIIQRGNEYTSMQHLSPDQLSQILQVIQQQQLMQTAKQSAGGQAVLYNPDSQTRIVYRVLSSDSHVPVSGNGQIPKVIVNTGGTLRDPQSRRVYRKRKKDDEERIEGFELSRQEKEERKKHRPRTRSGRVSRPPQYMVKDYKHIHPVDYDEDYDDSDGGYSDFRHSDEDESEDKHSKDGSFIEYELSDHEPLNLILTQLFIEHMEKTWMDGQKML